MKLKHNLSHDSPLGYQTGHLDKSEAKKNPTHLQHNSDNCHFGRAVGTPPVETSASCALAWCWSCCCYSSGGRGVSGG